ncbi:MAG: hypothetical protein ACK5NA_05025 [Enterococcus sp.]
MELIVIICSLLLFHGYLEKRGLPLKIEQMKLRYFLLLAILGIMGAIVVTVNIHIPIIFVGLVTILFATVIAYKYRRKFEQMERGENI